MRRATSLQAKITQLQDISTHALHAESDVENIIDRTKYNELISTHALHAESDVGLDDQLTQLKNFYPRSPCGERQQKTTKTHTKSTANL